MSRTVASVANLAALHDALGCATTAVDQAWCGDRDASSLSLTEAYAAAGEAFGDATPEVDALYVVLTAIAQAIHPKIKRPAADVRAPRLA